MSVVEDGTLSEDNRSRVLPHITFDKEDLLRTDDDRETPDGMLDRISRSERQKLLKQQE